MALGTVDALSAGRAHDREVVERGHRRRAVGVRERRQVEREIEQVVHVHHVGRGGAQHVVERRAQRGWPVRILEPGGFPVVHDFDDGQGSVHAPVDRAMGARRVELGAEHGHMVARGLVPREGIGVQLGSRLVAGQKVVDRVQNPQRTRRHRQGVPFGASLRHHR